MSELTTIDMTGQVIPNVVFRVRENDQWKDVSTEQLFKNKTVSFV